MKKRIILICLIGAGLLCVCNIVFACVWSTEAPNVFTAISGWISGIATAVLGGIALYQSKKYKEHDIRSNTVNNFIRDLDQFESLFNSFRKDFYPLKIFHILPLIVTNDMKEKLDRLDDLSMCIEEMKFELGHIVRHINLDENYYEHKKELILSLDRLMIIIDDVGKFCDTNVELNLEVYSRDLKLYKEVFTEAAKEFNFFIMSVKNFTKDLAIMEYKQIGKTIYSSMKENEKMKNEIIAEIKNDSNYRGIYSEKDL